MMIRNISSLFILVNEDTDYYFTFSTNENDQIKFILNIYMKCEK